jgi:signal transduction histidine kinase
MVGSPQPRTLFAPAERASDEELNRQLDYFADFSLLRQMLDAVPDIFLVLNAQRQIVFANKTLLDWLGLNPGDFTYGLRPGEALACVHASESEGGCGTTEFCRTCGAVQVILSSLRGTAAVQEYRITRTDGTALDFQVSASPLNLEGQVFSMFALKDISAEKRRDTLERIFFHDVLNTAGALMGFAEILMEAAPAELNMLTDRIYKLSKQIADEIIAQQEITSAENNELVVHLAEVDALRLLQEVAESYSQHEAASGKQILVDPRSQAVTLTSDVTLLRRVIGNMLKNALEASEPGQTVFLRCEQQGSEVVFEVRNSTFMPRNVQLQVFQRSFSTKGRGRGLGSYSMKLLSERYLKGRISFTTSQEEGTCFTARYPLRLESH